MNRGIGCICTGLAVLIVFCGCKKSGDSAPPPVVAPETFKITSLTVNNNTASTQYGISSPVIRLSFTAPVNHTAVAAGITLTAVLGTVASLTASFQNNDSTVILQPATALAAISKYVLEVKTSLTSQRSTPLSAGTTINFLTAIDSSNKFPVLSDSALLDLVQKQTFKYFWDFGHPVSGLARERSNGDDNVVTTGGSGFGIMSVVTAINRNFITRADGLTRIQTIAGFLKNTAQNFKGAFPHWLNGATGAVIPFSQNDDGADLVETSYLIQGLLCARQYFNGAGAAETSLRIDVDTIYNRVQWDWFRKNGEDVLYWHWSPNYNFDINQKNTGVERMFDHLCTGGIFRYT